MGAHANLMLCRHTVHARAAVGYIIDKGFYGDVSLDGLMAGFSAKFPGAVHEGNGEMQLVIDEQFWV